jgi:hypothetical protein
VGKRAFSTEWKSETLKYPLRSTVATLNPFYTNQTVSLPIAIGNVNTLFGWPFGLSKNNFAPKKENTKFVAWEK